MARVMRARLYACAGGAFEMVNSAGALFILTPCAGGFAVKDCGSVSEAWKGSGRLLRQIPNNVKGKFFQLNKIQGNGK